MLKNNPLLSITLALTCSVLTISCSEDNNELEGATDVTENSTISSQSSSNRSSLSPFDFEDVFEGDDFQVDNDGNGAHNWNEDEYEDDPEDNGFDIRDFIYVDGSRLILECPEGDDDDRRRAEFRDQVNIDLNDFHRMDFTFDIRNYDNNSELIMAQLHNDDSDARRPYITILAEDGEIRLQRTDGPSGSSSTRASETIRFRTNDRYRIRINTNSGTREVFTRIINLDTDERAQNTFNFASNWDDLDGNFYWKFGAYMPDGGSDGTQMRVERVNFMGQ